MKTIEFLFSSDFLREELFFFRKVLEHGKQLPETEIENVCSLYRGGDCGEKENLAIVSTSQLGKALIMKEGVLKYLYRQRIFCRKTMQSGTLVLNANFYLKKMKRVLMMLPNSYPLNRYTN